MGKNNKPLTAAEQLEANVIPEPNSGCFLWIGYVHRQGYGRFNTSDGRRGVLAHRASYELAYGPIPDGLDVLHRCDNPPCVRPDHLFLGTHADNMADAKRKGRFPVGEALPFAKLTWAKVAEIREALSRHETVRSIARRYGIANSGVVRIGQNKLWRIA